MTNEEALNVINSLIRQFTRLEQPTAVEGLNVAKEALEKQMPVELKFVSTVWGEFLYETWRCPKCMTKNDNPTRYCSHCGQKLYWGNEDES